MEELPFPHVRIQSYQETERWLCLNLCVLSHYSFSLFFFAESYSKNPDTQVPTMVLGPEQNMPDGNLALCIIGLVFMWNLV